MASPSGLNLRGKVFTKQDGEEYEAHRCATFPTNVPPRYPDFIVLPEDVADVVETVKYAASTGNKMAVRGGGHSWTHASVREGGILVSLSHWKHIEVVGSTAWVDAGVTNMDLLDVIEKQGLGFPCGHCSTVPMSGYLLNGGFGIGKWGPACFSLLEVECVNAAGEHIIASECENQDLFWLARGSGHGFPAIAVRFRIRLYPIPGAVSTAMHVFSLEDANSVFSWVRKVLSSGPDILELNLTIRRPKQTDKEAAVFMTANIYANSDEEADAAWLRLSTDLPATPLETVACARSSLRGLLTSIEHFYPTGNRYVGMMMFITDPDPRDLMERITTAARAMPPGAHDSCILVVPMPETPTPPPPGPDTPLSVAFETAVVGVYGAWQDAARDKEFDHWTMESSATLETSATGYYIGEVDLARGQHLKRSSLCFARPVWNRIRKLQQALDPAGSFFSYLDWEGARL
mmetsp:Transcript_21983/g.51550  ORF Transcript_21983/g.51550 Transcript_21983/m.51550 type:complete len:461 (+) Transcript_21983:2-1384(+)